MESKPTYLFEVEIVETLSKTILVYASDEAMAGRIAKDRYNDEEVVLDSGDHVQTDFNVL
jgi:hypothetical protein